MTCASDSALGGDLPTAGGDEAALSLPATGTNAGTARGPVHELDAGLYRAVIRDGVPVIERDNTAGAVTAILVPCSPEVVAELSAEWSPPVQWRIKDGEFVFRTVPT